MQTRAFNAIGLFATAAIAIALVVAINLVTGTQNITPLSVTTEEPTLTSTPLPNEGSFVPTLPPGSEVTATFTPFIAEGEVNLTPTIFPETITPPEGIDATPLPTVAVHLFSAAEGLIAFASTRDGNSEIYTTRADGSQLTNITQDPAPDFAPQWSPDGSRIAFVSERNGVANMYVMDANGTNLKQLTNLTNTDARYQPPFSWSPDGKTIATTLVTPQGDTVPSRAALHFISADDGTLTSQYDSTAMLAWPRWSSTGDYMAVSDMTSSAIIFKMENGQATPLTTVPCLGAFDWQPGTNQLTCITSEFKVVAYNVDGTVAADIWQFESTDAPALLLWSPDRSKLLMATYQEDTLRSHLCLFYVSTQQLQQLPTEPLISDVLDTRGVPLPSWSPDSNWVTFEYSPTGNGGMGVIFLQIPGQVMDLSSNQKAVDSAPQWQPNP